MKTAGALLPLCRLIGYLPVRLFPIRDYCRIGDESGELNVYRTEPHCWRIG
jgi:hypothetical protein